MSSMRLSDLINERQININIQHVILNNTSDCDVNY